MPQDEPTGPDLVGVVADADEAGLEYVVIDVAGTEHLRVRGRHGIVDIMRGGLPPLDFATVARGAVDVDIAGRIVHIADLRSLVGFKRLANRPQDRLDLTELEALHGPLPAERIPGMDA